MKLKVIIIMSIMLISCSNSVKKKSEEQSAKITATAPVVIYKSAENYYDKVFVILSEDKKTIVSYPHPKDVIRDGMRLYPTRLVDGYLLDRRGINANAAFLSINIEDYSKLKTAPALEELKKMIIDKEPIKEFYICNDLMNKSLDEINKFIEDGRLNSCQSAN